MKDCTADSDATLNRKKQSNGESIKILWWLLATVTGVLVTGAFFWVTGITTRLNTVDAAQVSNIERITRLEETFKGLSKDIAKIDQKLETTNEKLDKLLGRSMT